MTDLTMFKRLLAFFVAAVVLLVDVSIAEEAVDSQLPQTYSTEKGFVWIKKAEPVFPKDALYDPGCGYVELEYDISSDEKIIGVRVMHSSDRKFEKNAITALKNAKVKLVNPELKTNGLSDLSIRMVFKKQQSCGNKLALDFENRPEDLSTDVSHCLFFMLEPLKQKKFDLEPTWSGARNVSRNMRTVGSKVKLKNRCKYSVRASACYNYPISSKRNKIKCRENMVIRPNKAKGFGILPRGVSALGFSSSSVACIAKNGKSDNVSEPKLMSEIETLNLNGRPAQKVTGYCASEQP